MYLIHRQVIEIALNILLFKEINVSMNTSFHQKVKYVIKKIPMGKVATYGQIAAFAGNHRAARQVAWVLHSSSRKDKLPWHRVVNSEGRISLRPNYGYEIQKELLKKEGIKFDENDRIDFKNYLWDPWMMLQQY